MLWEEKHGGIWSVDVDYGDTLIFARHLPAADLIAYLFRRSDGMYVASIWRKTHYRKWRLPFWTSVEPAESFATEQEADVYLTELIGKLEAEDQLAPTTPRYESDEFAPMEEQTIEADNVVFLFPPGSRQRP
ncbi:MAG TPA: hypothetical protein VIM98_02765 [Dyella sp.]|uniref:hypothetical protein n=1 Tax=Dyella sp. TaxID=1869338 RepID=UPI002F94D694